MRPLAFVAVALLVLLLVGCPGGDHKDKDFAKKKAGAAKDKDKDAAREDEVGRAPERPGEAAGRRVARKQAEPVERKIIYTGRVEVIVDDFEEAASGLRELVKEFKGYIASSERTGTPGEPRWGSWTVRIPAPRFDDFVAAVTGLGELRRATRDSQDVTDAYHDTKAEITNLEVREQALRKLYGEKIAGSKLTDLLEVDRELNAVRGQINLRKGQLQRWDKLSSYATLTVQLQDRKSYVPEESPEFRTRLGRAWASSIEALVATAKGLTVAAVVLAPWLFVLAVVAVPAWLVGRRAVRRRAAARPRPLPAEAPTPPKPQP